MTLLNDIRYGFRMLVKRPGLSAIAIIALALGIGLTTTMFGIIYGVVIRGLPYEESENLIALSRNRLAQGIQGMGISIHDFGDWREQQTSFEDIAGFFAETVNVAGTEGKPIRYLGAYTSAHLFEILRVQPILGRTFLPEEDHPSTPPVLILSYRAWQDRYEGDPGVIGRVIRANSEMTTIVGVMPEKFGFPNQMDAWLPLRIDPLEYGRGGGPALEQTQFLAIARLRDGVSLETAQAEMTRIAGRIAAEYPETNEGIGVVAQRQIETVIGSDAPSMLYTMLGAVFGVLLIACANVANLLLARTVLRTKEVAIRTALGSSRLRTVSQLLSETLVLALAGAALGLFVAKVGVDWFNASIAVQGLPFWLVASLDPPVVAFVLGLALLSTLLAGTVPAFRASRTDISEILSDESRGSSSLRLGRASRGLVIAEIALSCGLLVAAGLMIKTVLRVTQFDYGFNTDNVFTSRIGLFEADYPGSEAQWQFYEELLRNLENKPGVRTVALSSDLPARGGMTLPLSVEGVAYASDQDHPLARRVVITPRYFDVIDAALLQGRLFTLGDNEDTQPVAIVNQSFVERNLSEEAPLGKRIKLGDDDEPWRTIVGVVPDLHLGGAIGATNPRHEGVYIPLSQNVINFMSLFMRTEEAPMTYTSMVQDEINAIDVTLPIYWVRSLNDQYALDTWFYRTFGTLFTAFGLAALSLATIGLYGVMSFAASNRTREIGVRMALGAGPKNVMTLILRMAATQIAIGLVLGLALALALSRAIGAMLFDVQPWDPVVFVTVVLTLAATGLVASLIPARRATRIDPVEALSYE